MAINIPDFIKKINISEIMSGANRTLNVAKKAIPVYKEVRPFFDGRKSIFKKNDKKEEVIERPIITKSDNSDRSEYNDNLTFFQ